MDYRKIETSEFVYRQIYMEHREELAPFSSLTDTDGGFGFGPRIMTEWGFEWAPVPLIGHEQRWEKNPDSPTDRKNVSDAYWFCVPVLGDDS